MKETFSSTALEVNLARTRDDEKAIPDEQIWFLTLSETKWGIHKLAKDFILELNHKYINYSYVIDLLHRICLNDLWFYHSLEASERANRVLVSAFKKLFISVTDEADREMLIKTLIKYMDRLYSLGSAPQVIIIDCFKIIEEDLKQHELLYIRNSSYFKTYLNGLSKEPAYLPVLYKITFNILDKTIQYWERTSDLVDWFKDMDLLFPNTEKGIIIQNNERFFKKLRIELENASDWEQLKRVLFFNDIANYFRSLTEEFETTLEKIYYISYLLNLPGMIHLKDHLLYDMNRQLRNVLSSLQEEEANVFIDNMMVLFRELKEKHGSTILDCIQTLGIEVAETKNQNIINHFITGLIRLGFHYPGKQQINDDWQIQINKNHIKNIRVWLELIAYDPYAMRDLLYALIVNLKLGGIFISDTDLFQRDVSKLLNSDITPVYREIKQLARIFPVYFREIGAEGKLREVTTAIDELSRRKDRLIHFLRKQTHTESNNTHIELIRKIILYWYKGDKEELRDMIPEDVYDWLGTEAEWLDGVHRLINELCIGLGTHPNQLLNMDPEKLEVHVKAIATVNERDKQRLIYLFQIESLLTEKYSLESEDIINTLKSSNTFKASDIDRLETYLENNDKAAAIRQIYILMEHLKNIILDPKPSEALENIYYKRHIAAGIPSMYGQYIEPKFDALGLMYRLEKTAGKLMVDLLERAIPDYVTAKTFRHLYDVLVLFKQGLSLDGIKNQGLDSNLEMFKYSLTSPSFSLDQYIDLFQFMAENIKQIIDEYFLDLYERPLREIVPQLFNIDLSPKDTRSKQRLQMESEKFLRDNLSSAFLVQDLDNFITNVISILRSMIDNYSDDFIENMLSYDPDLSISPLYRETLSMDNPVFLGAKAYFLKKLIAYDFPVPPGFVLTSEVFRHKETVTKHPFMKQEIDKLIEAYIREIETMSNKRFGDPKKPLLFSVRSGTSISLPGAMKTFLNVGMNYQIAEAFSREKNYAWAAWDCYRRFLQSWGMAYGIDRDVFDELMALHKSKYGVEKKIQFTSEQMKELSGSYSKVLKDYNIKIENDPFKQLIQAIHCVLDSWYSVSAMNYRNHMQIADEWGTAVIVQEMVLGNISRRSGSGVIFTNSPFNGQAGLNLYGDFALCGQGEDVVSGLVNTLPVTEKQRLSHDCGSSISLETAFPDIYKELMSLSQKLIEVHGFSHQEIEFTFESDRPEDLYILQTRNLNLKKPKKIRTFVPTPQEMKLVGRGIGIGGGALSGILAFDMEDLKEAEKLHPGHSIILIRPDTVPDDIPLIFGCDGLLTGKGGATSHAAVTAASLGKVCIVNCKGLIVNEADKSCKINGYEFKSGDLISIDGNLGNVYEGIYEIQQA